MATENLSPAPHPPAVSRPYDQARRGYGKRTARTNGLRVQATSRCFRSGSGTSPGTSTGCPRVGSWTSSRWPSRCRCTGRWPSAVPCGPSAWPVICGACGVRSSRTAEAAGSPARSGRVRPATASGGTPSPGPETTGPPRRSRRPRPRLCCRGPRSAAPGSRTGGGPVPEAVTAPSADGAALAPGDPAVPRQRCGAEPDPGAASPAYLALARLGRSEPRLVLSAADCSVLEGLACAWLDRGVDADYLTRALTAGLPAEIGSPVGFVRRRLIDKIPPRLPVAPSPAVPSGPVGRMMMECTECGAPGRPEALPGGLCRPCRTPAPGAAPDAPAKVPAERDVHALVGSLRNLMAAPERGGPSLRQGADRWWPIRNASVRQWVFRVPAAATASARPAAQTGTA
ncbi:MarR family transcriptional regulator [Streptomyces sp. M10(2022)]